MLVEKRICDVDGKLMIYHENLKRLKKRLDILKQIHEAPQVYAKLVVEVVRRRKFSTQFLKVTTLLQYNFFFFLEKLQYYTFVICIDCLCTVHELIKLVHELVKFLL